MNKFLDDANIVKKNKSEDNLELTFENNTNTEEIISEMGNSVSDIDTIVKEPIVQKTSEYDAPKTNKKKKATTAKTVSKKTEEVISNIAIKSEMDIMVEMLNKFNMQLISKQIDIEIAHELYKNANNTEERKYSQMSYEGMEKDIKTLKKKIDILQGMIARKKKN